MLKEIKSIGEVDFNHCLREEFTRYIIEQSIDKRESINLVGEKGTGKTRLLEDIRDCKLAGVKVILVDLKAHVNTYNGLLREIHRQLGLKEKVPGKLDRLFDGLEKEPGFFLVFLDNYDAFAQKQECKIILAFDEYEKVHTLFQKDPGAAEDLLAAMRSFSQHQDKVVFLFVGAALFSELKEPHWGNYFVQAELLKVDYLEKNDTFKLIDVAKLEYPQEVKDTIYFLTRGQPTLVQRICREMVNTANTQHRKTMTMKDLEEILEKHIYQQQNGVTNVFWGQFCAGETMKNTVNQVIAGKTPTDKKSLFKLTEHGFVIKENDRYQMRVPIFAEWIKRFGEVID